MKKREQLDSGGGGHARGRTASYMSESRSDRTVEETPGATKIFNVSLFDAELSLRDRNRTIEEDEDEFVRRLAAISVRVVEDIANTLISATVRPRAGTTVDVYDPNRLGRKSTSIDSFATKKITDYVSRLLPEETVLVGEEYAAATHNWTDGDIALIVDSVDGTAVVEDTHSGGAVVLMAFMRMWDHWERLGGSIGVLDATRSAIYWNAAGQVSVMWAKIWWLCIQAILRGQCRRQVDDRDGGR